MTDTTILIAVALVAFVIGGGLGYYLTAGRERRADDRAERARAELAAYRGNVTDHFKETAVKFRQLGEQYKALHEHLAEGAEALCEMPDRDTRLEFAPLAELEAPRAAAAAAAATAAAAVAAVDEARADEVEASLAAETIDDEAPATYAEPEDETETPAGPVAADPDRQHAAGETEVGAGRDAGDEERPEAAAAATGEPGAPAAAEETPRQPVDFPVETVDAGREGSEEESGYRTIH